MDRQHQAIELPVFF